MKIPDREKFNALRAKYLEARKAFESYEREISFKYGSAAYCSRGERVKRDRLLSASSRAGDKVFAYVQAISPRSWSAGVPCHWVYGELTFEDAVRPIDQPLSVVPPLSYGATVPLK